MMALMHWGRKHLTGDVSAGEIERRTDGARLAVGVVDDSGNAVPLSDVAFRRSA